ncbi:MAG: GNAT family N-acetyltransferase [Chloroflexota bacterium]
MQIRRANPTDAEALATIRRRAIRALAVPSISPEEAEKWARQVAANRFTRAIQDHEVWVAVETRVIGWIEIDHNCIAGLYVSPDCARSGIGSALLAHAENSIETSGCTAVYLDASQNALDFYLRRGYLRAGAPHANGEHPLRKALSAAAP